MATAEPDPAVPRAFITYSWDDDAHREWVKRLATRMRADGIDVTLDRWHAVPGDQLPAFMERAVRDNDFVIAVCTPRYKQKSDRRGGGVGYEGDIMTAEIFVGGHQRKFIPVLRRGAWADAAPSWLLGKYAIDLSGDPYSESAYEDLLRTLHGAREAAPPIGHRPNFGDQKGSQASPAPAPVTPPAGSSTLQDPSPVTPAVLRARKLGLAGAVIGAAAVLAYLASGWWGTHTGGPARPTGSPADSAAESRSNEIPGNRQVEHPESGPKGRSDTAVLGGYVTDAVTGRFLDKVELSLPDYNDLHGETPTCRTDAKGHFRFPDLPAGDQPVQRVRLVASKDGYLQSDAYTSLGTTTLPVQLQPATPPEH